MGLTVDVSARDSESDRRGTGDWGQVADVMGLLKVVPRNNFDNVGLHGANGLLPTVGEEDVGVLDPGVVVAVVEILELPGRDPYVDKHMLVEGLEWIGVGAGREHLPMTYGPVLRAFSKAAWKATSTLAVRFVCVSAGQACPKIVH